MSDLPDHLLAKYRKYGEFSSIDDLLRRSELFLVTYDLALDYATPYMPNTIHVGGLSVNPTQGKALPKEIEQFITANNDGVILFTFGSMVSTLPTKLARTFVEAFQNLSE